MFFFFVLFGGGGGGGGGGGSGEGVYYNIGRVIVAFPGHLLNGYVQFLGLHGNESGISISIFRANVISRLTETHHIWVQ